VLSAATFLGLPLLAWFLATFGLVAINVGIFVGRCIAGAEAPIDPVPAEPESAADFDDWLAAEGPLAEFRVWKCPRAASNLGRGPA
jgi:hypothetical protein